MSLALSRGSRFFSGKGRFFRLSLALAATGILFLSPFGMGAAEAGDRRQKAVKLVNEAADTTAYFAEDTAFKSLWNLADQAKAMVIIPSKIRAGFILGGAAGDAVMIARNKDGTWSQPTFMTIGSVSFGFQAGGEASELILLVMTEEGKESLLTSSVKLGGDISVAAGPYGAGAKAQTTDILAFSRSRGLYGGLSLEGSYLKSRRNWNKAYYDADVTPIDVIVQGNSFNPASTRLQNAVWALANRDTSAETAARAAPAQPSPVYDASVSPSQDPALQPYQQGTSYQGAPSYGGSAYGNQGAATPPSDASIYNPNTGQGSYEDDAVWGAPVRK